MERYRHLKSLKICRVRITPSGSHENGFDFGMLIQRHLQSGSHGSRHCPQFQIIPI